MADDGVDFHLRPAEGPSSARPARKPVPDFSECSPGLVGDYRASPDGVDSNLLILFHGLGDSHKPFAKLATSLRLPQTATLSLRAPFRIPLLEEEAYQWWDSFDLLTGDPISNPDPSKALGLLMKALEYLVDPQGGGWLPSEIHLFGFAQGGSCAAELALAFARAHPPTPERPMWSLGSLVIVSASLLSLPTPAKEAQSRSPVLLFLRDGEERKGKTQTGSDVESVFKKGFAFVERFKAPKLRGPAEGMEKMPERQAEWQPIMSFWAKHLKRRNPWEIAGKAGSEEVYEVTGQPSGPST